MREVGNVRSVWFWAFVVAILGVVVITCFSGCGGGGGYQAPNVGGHARTVNGEPVDSGQFGFYVGDVVQLAAIEIRSGKDVTDQVYWTDLNSAIEFNQEVPGQFICLAAGEASVMVYDRPGGTFLGGWAVWIYPRPAE